MLHGNILILTVSRMLWSVSVSIVFPYMSLYILELGGSKPIIGLVNAVGSLASIFLYPIGGYIADKSGRVRIVGFSTLLFASSFLLFALAPSWEWVAVGVAYQRMALFYMPALNAIMADSIPIGLRGRALALTIALPEAIRIITPYLGGWLISLYTLKPAMRIGFTLSLLLGVIVGLMRLRYLKETLEGEGLGLSVVGMLREAYGDILTSIRWVYSNLRGYILVALLLTFINSVVMPFWVVYAKEVIGLTPYQWGVVLLIGGVARVLTSPLIGGLIDRVGPRRCMLIALLIAAPSMALYTKADNLIEAAAVYIALVTAGVFIWIASSVLLADTIPRAIRGRVMAALGQGIGIGITGGGYAGGFLLFPPMTLGSLAGGYLYELHPTYPWLLQSTALAGALLLTLLLVREPERAEV
jgi:MFS family permease